MIKRYCNKELIGAAIAMACSIILLIGFYEIPYVDHFILNDIRYSPGTPGYEQALMYSRLIILTLACIFFGLSIHFGIFGLKQLKSYRRNEIIREKGPKEKGVKKSNERNDVKT